MKKASSTSTPSQSRASDTRCAQRILVVFFGFVTIFAGCYFPSSASAQDNTTYLNVTPALMSTEQPCHAISALSGSVSEKYGSPINFFDPQRGLLIGTYCNASGGVTVRAGDGAEYTYIYKYGYRREDGSWKRFTYTGERSVGEWFVGTAEYMMSPERAGTQGAALAYICQYVRNAWKCGCSDEACADQKWQRQEYDFSRGLLGDIPGLAGLSDIGIGEDTGELALYHSSATMVRQGDTLFLYGTGFSRKSGGNDILWNTRTEVSGVASQNGTTLAFTVPELPSGKYEVRVRADNKTSEESVVIWVQEKEAQTPRIDHIEPRLGEVGDRFTMYGEGFSLSTNDLVTSYGVISGLRAQNSTTLSFVFDPSGYEAWKVGTRYSEYDYPEEIQVTLVNGGGISNTAPFYISL